MNSISMAVSEEFSNIVFRDSHGQDVFYVDNETYKNVVSFLKEKCDVIMCIDITAVDYLGATDRIQVEGVGAQRFELVANFVSHKRNERIRLIVPVNDHDPQVSSIVEFFPGANFAEREVFDMFGITFDGHPDMTRILMPDEWEGHPLRKDDVPARIPVNFTDDLAPRSEVKP